MNELFEVKATVVNPEDETIRDNIYLTFVFTYDEEQPYGNKYYCGIYCKDGDLEFLWYNVDLRYNTEFDSDNKIEYVFKWVNNYWTGKNGAYKLNAITIK